MIVKCNRQIFNSSLMSIRKSRQSFDLQAQRGPIMSFDDRGHALGGLPQNGILV